MNQASVFVGGPQKPSPPPSQQLSEGQKLKEEYVGAPPPKAGWREEKDLDEGQKTGKAQEQSFFVAPKKWNR